MANEKMIPELRFPDFDGNWQIKELSQITNKISVGIATEVRPYISEVPSVVIIRNQNIRAGFFDDSDLEYIVKEFDEKNKSKRVKSGDVLIVRTGSNIGNACVVPRRYENSQTFTTLIVEPQRITLNSQFLSLHLNSFGLSEIIRLSAGAGKPNLNAGFLKRYRISIPSLPEQTKIAILLTAVDRHITLLTHKKEKLEHYKKGVMQKIFNQELKFKDEDGKEFSKWKELPIGELGNTFNGLSGKTKVDFGGGKPYIQYMQIFSSSKINTNQFGLVDILEGENQNRVQRGDVFFTTSSETPDEIGTASVLIDEVGELYLNSFCFGFRPNSLDDLVPEFAQYLFRSENVRKDIIKLAQGSTRYNMSKVELMKLFIFLPSKAEQQKIASFFSAIDRQINLVSTELTKMKFWKKGLLQKMFV